MSYLMSQFISLNLNFSKSIVAANGDSMPLAGIGSVDTPSVALSDVYYIPSLTINLASEVAETGHRQGDLYVLDHFRDIPDTVSFSVGVIYWSANCSGCKLAKFSALPFSNNVSSSNAPFDLVHSNVWGPSPVHKRRTKDHEKDLKRKKYPLNTLTGVKEGSRREIKEGFNEEQPSAVHF
ncbi:hypothetical protein Tco_0357627 [Tanacetum coccineum]